MESPSLNPEQQPQQHPGRKSTKTTAATCTSTPSSPSSASPNININPRPRQQYHCELDDKDCLTLANILESFSVISEEQAWAICYQCAKYVKTILNDPDLWSQCLLVTDTKHLRIHQDGQVHPDTFLLNAPSPLFSSPSSPSSAQPEAPSDIEEITLHRSKGVSEGKIISNLAAVIFHALDFGLSEDQERHLSADLENLIESMASAGECECDLGFVFNKMKLRSKDSSQCVIGTSEKIQMSTSGSASGDSDNDEPEEILFESPMSFDNIINICTNRLNSCAAQEDLNLNLNLTSDNNNNNNNLTSNLKVKSKYADDHYRTVCRSMVEEALALSSFLRIVSQGNKQIRTFSHFSPSNLKSGKKGMGKGVGMEFLSGMGGFPQSVSLVIKQEKEGHPQCQNHCIQDGGRFNFALWAQGWFQVMGELRKTGIHLKKVTSMAHTNSQLQPLRTFELTPFETLLRDIRETRYNLKKVVMDVDADEDGSHPRRRRWARDAHSIILEFIRSRPRLKKMEERVLRPPPKKSPAPREILMDEIRNKPPLKPVSPRGHSSPSPRPKNKNDSPREESKERETIEKRVEHREKSQPKFHPS